MKNIYAALQKYREAAGHLPTRQQDLRDLIAKPLYGIKLSEADLTCADAKSSTYAASKPIASDPRYVLCWNTKRPDGKKKPDQPAKGERDLWAFSNHYKRCRSVDLGGKYPHIEYYGFAVGLFSDGTVAVVRAQDMVSVRKGPNSWYTYFPMETGVPKTAMRVNEMAKMVTDEHRAASGK